jgi:hypothetical protein
MTPGEMREFGVSCCFFEADSGIRLTMDGD